VRLKGTRELKLVLDALWSLKDTFGLELNVVKTVVLRNASKFEGIKEFERV
jgi:hypothetical protein